MKHISRRKFDLLSWILVLSTGVIATIIFISARHTPFEITRDENLDIRRNLNVEEKNKEKEEGPKKLRFKDYDAGGPCIVLLVSNRQKSLTAAKIAVESLVLLRDNDDERPAPVHIFHKGGIDLKDKEEIKNLTRRPVSFPRVMPSQLPNDFVPENEDEKLIAKGVPELTQYELKKFWVLDIWRHPAVERFSTIMRIASDACFNEVNNEQIPYFRKDNLVYHSEYFGYDKVQNRGLIDFAETYMKKIGHYPTNPLLWRFAKNVWESDKTLPVFNTKFEIARKAWMQHPDVENWHKAVVETPPYEMYRNNWSDAAIRFLTAAMFAPNFRIDTSIPQGFSHQVGCSQAEIRTAISLMYG